MVPQNLPSRPTPSRKHYQRLLVAATNATDKTQAAQTLAKILADRDGEVFVSSLDSTDVKLCIEILSNVSPDLQLPRSQPQEICQGIAGQHLKPAEKRAFFIMLRRFAEHHGLLPSRVMITEKIDVSDEILGAGGFGDIRAGMYRGRPVAVKVSRITTRDDLERIRKVSIDDGHPGHPLSTISLQRFYREVVLWSTLSHPNIMNLVGVQEDVNKRQFSMVSEWMSRGNIMEYIKNNYANRLELVRGITSPRHFLR